MAKKATNVVSGAELRARREARLGGWPDTRQQAEHHEAAFLKGLDSARDALAWIQENRAWLLLGHESYVAWWQDRVQPVLEALNLRPAPDMARQVITQIKEEQKALPAAQRMSNAEITRIVGASDWVGRGRQDPHKRRTADHPDLEGEFTDAARPAAGKTPVPLQGISQGRAMDLAKVVGEAYGLPTDTAAEGASRLADGGTDTTSAVPPAAGPGPTQPSGEADRLGPVVNPTNLDDAVSGDVEAPPSPVQGGIGDGGQAERGESHDSPPAGPAEPAELTSPLSGEADPEQDGTGVTRPAPDPSDPAALLDWLAERWEQVDADVSGPLLTDDDVLLLEASLNRVVFTFELLIKWRDRAQP